MKKLIHELLAGFIARYVPVEVIEVALSIKKPLNHPYENIHMALMFMLSSACDDVDVFLRTWGYGEWARLDSDWPEWKAFVAAYRSKEEAGRAR